MIKQIINNGFKDQKKKTVLSGLDFISSDGNNGVGKSAVLESFKLALLGEIPGRAKTVEDIMRFTSQNEIGVQIDYDSPRGEVIIERRFLKESIRGEKRPIRINHKESKFEEGSHWIRENVGAISVCFDPYEFLNLSDNKKRQWILSHSPESMDMKFNVLKLTLTARILEKYFGSGLLLSLLASFGLGKLQEIWRVNDETLLGCLTSEIYINFRRQDENLFLAVDKILEDLEKFWDSSFSFAENISVLLKNLKSEILKLKGVVREQATVFSYIEQFPSHKREENAKGLEKCRENIQSISRKIELHSVQIERARQNVAEQEKKRERMAFLRENIFRLKEFLDKQNIGILQQKLNVLKKEIQDIRPLDDKFRKLIEKQSFLLEKFRNHQNQLQRISRELNMKREKQVTVGSPKLGCPVAEGIQCATDMTPFLVELVKEINVLTGEEKDEKVSVKRAQAGLDSNKDKIEKMEVEVEQDRLAKKKLYKKMASLQQEINMEEKESAKSMGLLKAYQEELSNLELETGKFQNVNKFSENSEILHTDREQLENLRRVEEDKLSVLFQEQGQIAAAKELFVKRKRAQRKLEIMNLINDLLGPEGIQGELVQRISGELEEEVNEILKLIDPEFNFSVEMSPNKFEMGWNRDGTIIPFSTINSAHFILLIVPFLTAIVQRMARSREKNHLPTLKALCVEAESLTPGNLVALLKGLSLMKERGYLDNVLVAHYHSIRDPKKLYGFREHILVGQEEMEGAVLA